MAFAQVQGVGGARSILARRTLARSISPWVSKKLGFARLSQRVSSSSIWLLAERSNVRRDVGNEDQAKDRDAEGENSVNNEEPSPPCQAPTATEVCVGLWHKMLSVDGPSKPQERILPALWKKPENMLPCCASNRECLDPEN